MKTAMRWWKQVSNPDSLTQEPTVLNMFPRGSDKKIVIVKIVKTDANIIVGQNFGVKKYF